MPTEIAVLAVDFVGASLCNSIGVFHFRFQEEKFLKGQCDIAAVDADFCLNRFVILGWIYAVVTGGCVKMNGIVYDFPLAVNLCRFAFSGAF